MSFGLYQEDALMDKDKYECTIGQEMIGTAAYAHDRCLFSLAFHSCLK